MSLSSKLIVYAYYGSYNLPHERYGESYQLYRIVHEYLTDTYAGGASCVRRDIATARCLNSGALCFDAARQLLDVGEVVARLSAWYRRGEVAGLCGDVQAALADLDRLAPREARAGGNIFDLDALEGVPRDAVDSLQVVIGRFMHFARCGALERVADVFDPSVNADGWWYHKFCVVTYMRRIIGGSVPAERTARLRAAAAAFIKPDDEGNCAPAVAEVYARFCGIGREHFAQHKTGCMHILFQHMRDDLTPADARHPCFATIADFARQCKGTYVDLRPHVDALYIHAVTDRRKNALFDLLCCANAADIDVDCYDYVVNKFYLSGY